MRCNIFRLVGGPLVVLLCSSAISAQTVDRGWVDVNFASLTPTGNTQTFNWQTTYFSEPLTLQTDYPKLPRANGPILAAGAGIGGGLGVAVEWINTNYEYTVGLGVNVPSPVFFNRFASANSVTNTTLKRRDNAIDISAVYQVPTRDTFRIRVFGGPTYFSLKQDFVDDIAFSQVYNLAGANNVTITRFSQTTVDESTWGFHVGGDVGYYFTRHLGVGGGVRYNRGTVSLKSEPLSEQPADLTAGGTVVNGGLRFRY